MERPEGWSTVSSPDGTIRYWVVATDPVGRPEVEPVQTQEGSITTYVRRGTEVSSVALDECFEDPAFIYFED